MNIRHRLRKLERRRRPSGHCFHLRVVVEASGVGKVESDERCACGRPRMVIEGKERDEPNKPT